ncbi:MAG: hypothetical protein ACHP7P_03775 [Terriglobales bacterium]
MPTGNHNPDAVGATVGLPDAAPQLFEALLELAHGLDREQLPALLGRLEQVRVTAMARLTCPSPSTQAQADELLDVAEAARRLGVSRDFLYRHHGRYSFTVREGRRLLFSSRGIDMHIRQKRKGFVNSLT